MHWCIEPGPVISLTHMFCIVKGLSSIGRVYNGTLNDWNEVLSVPRFGLSTVRHTL